MKGLPRTLSNLNGFHQAVFNLKLSVSPQFRVPLHSSSPPPPHTQSRPPLIPPLPVIPAPFLCTRHGVGGPSGLTEVVVVLCMVRT